MTTYICTVIVNRVGKRGDEFCPMPGDEGTCSAPTGRHHSFLVEAENPEDAKQQALAEGHYVARVEEAIYL